MFVLGLGLGSVMQVLVLAVQNAVDYHDLGVATSGATLFRSIGGSVGTAVLGSIFCNRLSSELNATLPPAGKRSLGSGGSVTLNPADLAQAARPDPHDLHQRVHQRALDGVRGRRRDRRGRIRDQLAVAGSASCATASPPAAASARASRSPNTRTRWPKPPGP